MELVGSPIGITHHHQQDPGYTDSLYPKWPGVMVRRRELKGMGEKSQKPQDSLCVLPRAKKK